MVATTGPRRTLKVGGDGCTEARWHGRAKGEVDQFELEEVEEGPMYGKCDLESENTTRVDAPRTRPA